MTIELVPGGRVKVSSPTPSFTQVRPPSAPAALVSPGGARGPAGPPGADGLVTSVVAGSGVTVDSADPAHPVVSATFSGAYADLSGKPTLGTAAAQNTTVFATAAQGVKADAAVAGGNGVNAIWSGTQAAYDAIGTKVSTTLYIVV